MPTTLDPADPVPVHHAAGLGRVKTGPLSASQIPDIFKEVLIPIDFIRGITADHVLDGLVPARMVWEPRVDFQHILVDDDDGPPFGNESFYFPC